MYRFLRTPRWLGLAALTVLLAGTMVLLGNWQLDRYRTRSAINARIDAAATAAPVPLTRILPPPRGSAVGPAPSADSAWTRVAATGRYDPTQEILARGRTVDDRLGFEIVTPLVLADGTAVLVDRGWFPEPADASGPPTAPPAPSGEVTIVGRVHLSESRPGPMERRDGYIGVRRIALPQLATALPYPIAGGYVLLDSPGPSLVPVPSRKENAWQNGGYVVQWWLFAALTVVGFGWLARREAHDLSGAGTDRVDEAPGGPGTAPDRAEADPARG